MGEETVQEQIDSIKYDIRALQRQTDTHTSRIDDLNRRVDKAADIVETWVKRMQNARR